MIELLFMLFFRIVLLGIILVALVSGDTGFATINSIVWVMSLFVPYMGRNDKRYYVLDAFSMAAFVGIFFVSKSPLLLSTLSAPFGIDKFFHVLGGACAAWFMILTFEKSKWNIYLAIFLGTLTIGISWEIFEYVLGLLPPPFYHEFATIADSSMDLVADLVGAGIVTLLYKFSSK